MLCWKCHSSSCSLCRPQSSPSPAIRATRPLIAPYSRWWRDTPFSFTLRSQASDPYSKSDPLRASTSTVDDRDIAEAPFFAGRLPYCRPKPSPPPRPVNYTPPVCVEQNYRSATTWRMENPSIVHSCCRNNVATVIQDPSSHKPLHVLIAYPSSLLIVAVRPAQHPAAALRFIDARRRCIFSSSTAVSSSSSPDSSQLS